LENILEAREIVEHLPYGPASEEVYMSMDWVDRYMTGMDTLWDTDMAIIGRVLGSVTRAGHQLVQGDTVVCGNMQGFSLAYGSGQWSFGVFPPGRPPNKVLEHTLDLRLPRIEEWMGQPQGAAYTSIIELHRGCQQMRIREPKTHRSVPKYHQGVFVMTLGLTNTLVTLQSYRHLSRHLLLWVDALSRTREDYQSQLSETGNLVAATETIHWDLVICVQGAQRESQIMLELCTEFSTVDVGSSRLPMR
jgi:hypothetical protein